MYIVYMYHYVCVVGVMETAHLLCAASKSAHLLVKMYTF